MTVELTEFDISDAIADALAIDNPLLRDPQADSQPGKIVITGQHDQRDSAILAQITSADIEGIDLSDSRIATINSRIAERVTRRTDRENRQITVLSVTVTDTAGEVMFNVQRT